MGATLFGNSLLLDSNREVLERTTRKFTGAVFKDDAGDPIPAGSLTTLTLTLYDKSSGNIINSRNGTDVLNANGGTVDAAGNFEMLFTHLDNVIVGSPAIGEFETHVALFEWTYSAGSRHGKYELEIRVKQLDKVP